MFIWHLNWNFWSRFFCKHFWEAQFWNLLRPCTLVVLQRSQNRFGFFIKLFLNCDNPTTSTPRPLAAKVNLTELSQDAKKQLFIAPILFLYYELSVCPLILNYNKIYFLFSLIAKPSRYIPDILCLIFLDILPVQKSDFLYSFHM